MSIQTGRSGSRWGAVGPLDPPDPPSLVGASAPGDYASVGSMKRFMAPKGDAKAYSPSWYVPLIPHPPMYMVVVSTRSLVPWSRAQDAHYSGGTFKSI